MVTNGKILYFQMAAIPILLESSDPLGRLAVYPNGLPLRYERYVTSVEMGYYYLLLYLNGCPDLAEQLVKSESMKRCPGDIADWVKTRLEPVQLNPDWLFHPDEV